MAKFERGMGELLETLKKEELYQCKLKPDIENGEVFFAIRNGYCSFYVNGSSLFSYDKNGFTTHHKFGFVPASIEKNYIAEDELRRMKVIDSFASGYKQVKERAKLYAGEEASGVSALYSFAPRTSNKDSRYFLVDIEIVFNAKDGIENLEAENGKNKTDRIDILLYDNQEGELLFCEAKLFSNLELWAKKDNKPRVVKQLIKYNKQIENNESAILEAYTTAFEEYNKLLETDFLHPPESVCKQCGLLIFGYDKHQRDKIEELLIKDGSLTGHKHKAIGDIFSNCKKTDTVRNIFTSCRVR